MAEALEALYPGIKFGIGPALENGFYYDVSTRWPPDFERGFCENRAENHGIGQAGERLPAPGNRQGGGHRLFPKGDEYKLELLEELEDGKITFYHQGNFTDLCRGPHIPDTGKIKAVKLMKIGSVPTSRGDDQRNQLTRIYGITFPKQKELTEGAFCPH